MIVKIINRTIDKTIITEYTKWYKDKIGHIFDVVEAKNNMWYKVVGTEDFILKEDAEIMDMPKLESGMIVEFADGRYGLVVQDAILMGTLQGQSTIAYEQNWLKITSINTNKYYKVRKIFQYKEGVCPYSIYGKEVIWEGNNSVKLNDDYTAEVISKNKVTVGCQTFDIEKLREIVEIADKWQ